MASSDLPDLHDGLTTREILDIRRNQDWSLATPEWKQRIWDLITERLTENPVLMHPNYKTTVESTQ